MNQKLFPSLLILMAICLWTCKTENLNISIPENPCRPISVTFTVGTVATVGTEPSYYALYDGKGSDTVWVNYEGVGDESDYYLVFEYDSDEFPTNVHRYNKLSGDLIVSSEMTWWERGLKKEVYEVNPSGELSTISDYDIQQNISRFRFYSNGSIAQDYRYDHTYNSDNQLLETREYEVISGSDTIVTATYSYDADGRLISKVMNNDEPNTLYPRVRTEYEYDTENRIIKETLYNDFSQRMISNIQTTYINGELAYQLNYFDANNELTTYRIIRKDIFQNMLLNDYYTANGSQLSKVEYEYICE